MKYFTKEWNELCQKTNFYLPLEEDKQAEIYSEEYFQQLYHTELYRWLDLQEEVAATLKERKALNKDIEYEPFNRDKGIEQFHYNFLGYQHYCQKELPETIINQIADLRVFVLNKASRHVINAVTKFCELNDRSMKKVVENYRSYYEEASKSFDKEIVDSFHFHDCKIIKAVQNDRHLTLILDNSGGFTNVNEVTFRDYKVVKQDASLEDSICLYEEVYKVDESYEFHILLYKDMIGLCDFILSAEQISFK